MSRFPLYFAFVKTMLTALVIGADARPVSLQTIPRLKPLAYDSDRVRRITAAHHDSAALLALKINSVLTVGT